MNCPFRNSEEYPEHNKKGGCAFWLSYTVNCPNAEAQVEGSAVSLTPLLLLENANNLGAVAGEISMASLLFGISFRNPDTGEEAQLVNQLYVRSTRGGDWSVWEKVGGKWAAPLTLRLTGAVTGSLSFDGSEGTLSWPLVQGDDAMDEAAVEKIARRIAGELIKEHEQRYFHSKLGN